MLVHVLTCKSHTHNGSIEVLAVLEHEPTEEAQWELLRVHLRKQHGELTDEELEPILDCHTNDDFEVTTMPLITDEINKPYTVVGIYEETGQRFCEHVEAPNAMIAEKRLVDEDSDRIVAGVFAGHLVAVDDCPVTTKWAGRIKG